MSVPTKATGDGLILSPREALVAGGAAEEFESRVQDLFKAGYRNLVTDLRGVTQIDSAGIRSLVRGLTTSQRLGGSFRLVAPSDEVKKVLKLSRMDSIFPVFDSVAPAMTKKRPWKSILLFVAGVLVVGAVAFSGFWMGVPATGEPSQIQQLTGKAPVEPFAPFVSPWQPFLELGKLVLAATIGIIITAVHRRYRQERPQTQSMEQAQVLLCVSGAMMMIIIGNSLARAFGIAGAASIIRFRTPVEDPKDITILFLLMGLGMSAGLGAYGVAGLGTIFLCAFLVVLDRVGARRPRAMMVEVAAEGRDFPTSHVQTVFARNKVIFEPREVSQGKELSVRYHALLDADQSLEDISEQLMAAGKAGVKSVSWELPKKSE
jgi:anti-anti-sigma factor